jgi:threonine aldolase
MIRHDFFSDTKTKPTQAMRESILSVLVGDEQKGEDPTTTALCERVASLLGKEAAVFMPSGSMCNSVAIRVHTQPGDEIICERSSHIFNYEVGSAAALSGVMIHPLDGLNGTFEPDQVEKAIRPKSRYMSESRLLCVEQTTNLGGGQIWPLETLQGVSEMARSAGLSTHMDGARLMNAVIKSGIPASDWTKGYDSCWLDFSKGLGAPVGAVLAGSESFIQKAWRIKQQFGGAMRQSGILAAMCLYSLDNHVERLAEDHKLAAWIGKQLTGFPWVRQILPVETNILICDLSPEAPDAESLVEKLDLEGISIGAFGPRRIRIVTHLDVDEMAAEVLCESLKRYLSPPP